MDYIDYQINLERLFSKNQLIPRIKAEFTNEHQIKQHMLEVGIDLEFGYDLLTQLVLHKRMNMRTAVGILRRHYGNSQQTVGMLKKCAEHDLCDWSPVTEEFIIKIDITDDVKEELDRFQYPLPMIVEPKEIKRNTQSGYLTIQSSVILKNNHHDDDVCLDHLNRVNKIKFRINHDVAQQIHNTWKGLDKPKEGETISSFKQRQLQFKKYDETCKDIFVHAEVAGGEFYLTHKYDKRGRVYSQGYHVNYQGNTWNKATIEFAEGEMLNEA
ncbi:RNAP1-like RNA polymerase protein [Rhizobium phage RHEph24]|nr:RNAP1-like RNA polymerase protein [Rhizobium phage RHEph24]